MANPWGTDAQTQYGLPVSSPAFHAAAITPSNSVNFDTVARAIYVGTTGNIVIVTPNDEVVTFTAVPVGILPVMAKRVNSTSTTASNLVALW